MVNVDHPWLRVTAGDLARQGQEKNLFIRKEELEYDPHREVQYLKDDALRFKVADVTETS